MAAPQVLADGPAGATRRVILAHGAGAAMDTPFMNAIAGGLAAEGILVLPHIGGPHPQRDRIVARLFVENLSRFLDGEELKEVVDRSAGY